MINTLVDQNSIEGQLLFETEDEATAVMKDDRRRPRYAANAWVPAGNRIFVRGGTVANFQPARATRARLGANVQAMLADIETRQRAVVAEGRANEVELKAAQAEVRPGARGLRGCGGLGVWGEGSSFVLLRPTLLWCCTEVCQ